MCDATTLNNNALKQKKTQKIKKNAKFRKMQ